MILNVRLEIRLFRRQCCLIGTGFGMVSLNVGAMPETAGETVVANIASLYTGTVKTAPSSIATKYHGEARVVSGLGPTLKSVVERERPTLKSVNSCISSRTID